VRTKVHDALSRCPAIAMGRCRILGRAGLCVSEFGCGCAPFGLSNYIESWDATSPDAERTVDELVHFRDLDTNRLGEMLLDRLLSDLYVDCALVGTCKSSRLASNEAISDDVASRIDFEDLHQYFLSGRSHNSV